MTTVRSGRLLGQDRGGVTAYLGVPYAATPVGRLRFRPPGPAPSWTGVRDATSPGPAAPQPPSRLEAALGPTGVGEQDEDCLRLNVWAPAHDGGGPLPVLVWLHGGAFLAGSGAQPWYDGARLAAERRAVVVTVSHRLGALGYLRLPDGTANLGLLDGLAALHWVVENVEAFGGDPTAVTLAGQSSGAQSALALFGSGRLDELVERVVLMSAPLGLSPLTPDEAAERTDRFLAVAGADAPVGRLLEAQTALDRALARPFHLGPAFQLVADGLVAADLLAVPPGPPVEVVVGCTEHEADAFCVPDPRVRAMTPDEVTAALAPLVGPVTVPSDASPARVASDLTTRHFFQDDLEPLAATLRAGGRPTRTYRFRWHPAGNPLRACHGIELPFVVGNLDAWRDAPLLRGADDTELRRVSDEVRAW